MDRIQQLLGILAQLAALSETVAGLVEEGKDALSSTDEAALKGKLAEIRQRNDATYDRVQDKLKAAQG